MGVNMAKTGIVDDKACREAGKQEIIRRYFRYFREKVEGIESQDTLDQMYAIMNKVSVKPSHREVVVAAEDAAKDAELQGKGHNKVYCGAAIKLHNNKILTGKNTELLHAESAVLLNSIKELSKIPDEIDLLSPEVLRSIIDMKRSLQNNKSGSLNVNETLIALAISSATNPSAKKALSMLSELENCEMHMTHLPTPGDEAGLIRLKMNVTTNARISSLPSFQ